VNTPFESLKDEEKQEWVSAYAEYKDRMKAVTLEARPFDIWLTDFGYTSQVIC